MSASPQIHPTANVASAFETMASPLPVLRDDLDLLAGPRTRDGAPTWTVYDPVRARYFRISQTAFELLNHWHLHDWADIANTVMRTTGRRPTDGERDWMVRFLHTNMLIRRDSAADMTDLETVGRAAKSSWIKWALHHYLFFRIPLVRPQRFLDATLPLARALTSKTAMTVLLLIGALGGYLTLRQWDTYLATFVQFTTPESLLWYGLALAFTKVLHEMGHAYTAAHYGCRVPSMGAAFLVMWPVLYTDTSEAWRLTSKRQRIAIGAAGMITEMTLAVLATFLWSFLPDGPVRSAAFVIATVTWIMTLAVNLNPFMRFDGYYLLSDALGVENLQERAFARARWWLRERLFALGEAAPEAFPGALGRILIGYAIATWVYRLVLFLGIAALVYAFFFKLLGIFLFAVEIIWFVALPIVREGRQWWERRTAFRLNRNAMVTFGCAVFAAAVMILPWRTSIAVPAVLQSAIRSSVYAPVAARVLTIDVNKGDHVAKGDVLLTLDSPDLDFKIIQARLRIAQVRMQVRREAAGGAEAENIRVLQRRLAGELTTLRGLEDQQAQLTVRAPHNGRVVEFDPALTPGLWIKATRPLALVIDETQARLNGFVDEGDVTSITVGAAATFYPEDPARPAIMAHVTALDDVNSRALDIPYLASVHGGDVAVKADRNGQLVALHGIYRVTLTPDQPHKAPAMVQRGTVHVEGEPHSFIVKAWNRVWGVLVRESGF